MKIIAFPSVASVTTAAAVSHIPLTFASYCSYYGPVSPFTEKSQVTHLCFINFTTRLMQIFYVFSIVRETQSVTQLCFIAAVTGAWNIIAGA
jgi:hypothetical protein